MKLVARSRELISPAQNGEGFARRYYKAMQRGADAVLAHRDMMRVFDEL